MTIIRHPLAIPAADSPRIRLAVDRMTLAKRRWRGVAEDGAEFGVDLDAPLPDGAAVFQCGTAVYVLAQRYEPVLEVRKAECGMQNEAEAARLGWMIGNLHFQIEITGDVVRVVDDPAVRQLFEREHIAFTACMRVFKPLSGAHHH